MNDNDLIFYVSGVEFPLATALRILKKSNRHSLEQILAAVPDEYKNFVQNKYSKVPPITPKNVLKMTNAEQRRVALTVFNFSELLEHFEHKVIDKQTITKTHTRWSINENGELEPYEYAFEDTYELIEIQYEEKSQHWWQDDLNITIRGVRCKCTTTQREYFIFIPPDNLDRVVFESPRYTQDAIKAICKTFRVNVKPEAVKAFRRQGDVILTIINPKYKDNWQCEWRTITKKEYIKKLEVET